MREKGDGVSVEGRSLKGRGGRYNPAARGRDEDVGLAA